MFRFFSGLVVLVLVVGHTESKIFIDYSDMLIASGLVWAGSALMLWPILDGSMVDNNYRS